MSDAPASRWLKWTQPTVAIAALWRHFRRFLLAPAAPLNLAVLRVVVFSLLLYLLVTESVRDYAALPRESFTWPAIAGPILKRLPIDTAVVDALMPIAIIATILAIVGCVTRTAAWVSVVLAMYLLGITQCSGAVNHTMQHVVLIGMLIACSRAGDALSIDSLWQAFRRADHGQVRSLGRKVRYGMPIRFSMIVLAVCYFFPGLWQLAVDSKSAELAPYAAKIPLGSVPGSTAIGLLTLLFTLSGPLALAWRPTRTAWAAIGLLLHQVARPLVSFGSYTLQAMYVLFVDWQYWLHFVGRKVFGEKIVVLYDGNCKLCRRTMALLLALDWLQMLKPINAFDREYFARIGLGHLDDVALMTDMHAAERISDGGWSITQGYAAYQRIAWRVPLLWLTLPLIYLPPVVSIGRSSYRRVADSRACSVRIAADSTPSQQVRWTAMPLVVVAVAILTSQIVVGLGRVSDAWPAAYYPVFDQPTGVANRSPDPNSGATFGYSIDFNGPNGLPTIQVPRIESLVLPDRLATEAARSVY